MRSSVLTLIFILSFIVSGMAQSGFGVAYYDVDRFYDTLPSTFYDDSDYTPDGRMCWTSERYCRKVESVAKVIDSMSMPVVVLYGVENEQVVRDIVEATSEDYAYVHRTQDYNNGLDFAMLYFADKFFIERVTPWRGALCVEGEFNDSPLTIVAANRCTSLRVLFEERNLNREANNIILVGRPSQLGFSDLGLRDCSLEGERAGRGNIFSNGRWIMRDRVATNISHDVQCEVYIKSWLLDSAALPKPTFDKLKYRGGFSSALPIYIIF